MKMIFKYILVLVALLEFNSFHAQTIQLGTGTATNGTTTSSPVNIFYRRTVAQFVYTSAELNAAGITGPCDLQDLGWFVTNSPIYNIPGYTVKVKHVGANNVVNALGTTGWTTIKGPFTYNPTAVGWDMLGLDNTFTWNGTDNIGVEVCWSQVQPSWSGSGQCRIYSTTSGYRYSWTDAGGNSCGATPNTITTNKPQVQMVWSCAPPCTTPAPPSASGVNINCGDTATLTASGAPSNGYYIWYNDLNGTNQVGTGSSFTTPSLNGNTTYYVSTFVPTNCESSLTAVTVNVNSNITSPTANNITVDCGDPAILTASGSTGNYIWFSDANGNNPIGTGNLLSLGNLFADSTVYVAASASQSGGQTTYNFTNCGSTGHLGPNQTQVNTAYFGTNLEGEVNVTNTGIQEWVVPSTGTYTIEVAGAGFDETSFQRGALITGEFSLTAGDVLQILVGQMGQNSRCGSGGSFVALNGAPLVVAGGAGGQAQTTAGNAVLGGWTNNNGQNSITSSGAGTGGTNGSGGGQGGSCFAQSGAGFSGNGVGCDGIVAQAFTNGGAGATSTAANSNGGFGGGGTGRATTNYRIGGGGGYSGGASAGNNLANYGGGGGSFNAGANAVELTAQNAGHGYVTITGEGTASCLSNLVAVTASVNPLASPTVSASPTVICENGTAILTANGAPANGDYIWYNDPNGANQIGTGNTYTSGSLTNNTTFYVQTTDGSGTGNTESLTTTFAAGNGQNGNMFNINVLDDIVINDFDVHQYANQTGDFEVYYKTGTYNGFETNAGAWTLVGTATNITSNGTGNPTPLNLNLGLQLNAGTYAFYVTGTNTSVHYTNGTNTNNIYAQNAEIEFFEGVGKSYPFGSTFSPRIWNGTIHYQVGSGTPSCLSVLEPITINVDQQPTQPSIIGGGTYCLGEEILLSENTTNVPASQLEWYENNNSANNLIFSGTDNITVVPSSPTDYIVVANSANGACPPAASNIVTVNIPTPTNVIAPNNTTSTCSVNQNGWVHFLDNNGRLIASVNSLGQNLGNISATMYEENSPLLIEACNTPFIGYQTSVMDRHWVITPDVQPTSSVLVRLPFENSTLQSLTQESGNNQNPDDNVSSINDVFLSKYSGPTNIDDDFENNCTQNGGSGDVQFYPQNFNNSVPTMGLLNNHPTTDLFAEFEIPNFSEFWLHGSNMFSPLPVELSRFEVVCEEKQINIIWQTETENNNDRFELEKSIDGHTWEKIHTELANGNSQTSIRYNYIDHSISQNLTYYRLKQFDVDGEFILHNPISANCKFDFESSISIHPNPNNGNFTLDLTNTIEEIGEVEIKIISSTGKEVYSKKDPFNTNNQQINFYDLNLSKGSYLIRVVDGKGSFRPVKLIIT